MRILFKGVLSFSLLFLWASYYLCFAGEKEDFTHMKSEPEALKHVFVLIL
jgi:hypothetical protein